MTKQTLKRLACLICILAALTACKEKTEIVEEIRAIKTITVKEQAADQIRKLSGIVAAVDSSGLSFEVRFHIAKLDNAQRDLRKTKLLAPYEGTIAWRSVDPNEEVYVGNA